MSNQSSLIPKDTLKKLDYFNDLVMTMFAGNTIAHKEMEFCKIVGRSYGYSEPDIISYIKIIENAIRNHEPINSFMPKLGNLMQKYL